MGHSSLYVLLPISKYHDIFYSINVCYFAKEHIVFRNLKKNYVKIYLFYIVTMQLKETRIELVCLSSWLTFYSTKLYPAYKLLFCQTLSRRNFYSAKLYPAETSVLPNSILPKCLFCQTLSCRNFCSANPYPVVKMFCLAFSWNFLFHSILNCFHHKNDEWPVWPSG